MKSICGSAGNVPCLQLKTEGGGGGAVKAEFVLQTYREEGEENQLNLDRFSFVRSVQPRRTGSGQFKWKGPRRARTFFPP